VSVWGKDGNILANMQVLPDGGGVSVWNKGGKPRAAMSISFGTNEGCVHVLGDDGNPRASIFTEADSGKVVVTNNKGVTTGQLP